MKHKKEIKKIIKDIWYNVCILEHDYGIGEYMLEIVKFVLECIADKYKIDLELRRN